MLIAKTGIIRNIIVLFALLSYKYDYRKSTDIHECIREHIEHDAGCTDSVAGGKTNQYIACVCN